MSATSLSSLIWSIAELLRGNYRQSDYGNVILPFTLLRRLDSVLAPTKQAVLDTFSANKGAPAAMIDQLCLRASGQSFYNTSRFDVPKLLGDADQLKLNLLDYLNGFSDNAGDIFDKYEFLGNIQRLDGDNLLFMVVQKFASFDLSPASVSNMEMGQAFEELIRRFAELSNETAGEHFTPREVIRLMVDLLFHLDDEVLAKGGTVRTLYDPCAGTGGMLSVADEHLFKQNPNAKLALYGQELNPESYAVCKADMLIKGQDVGNIIFGNTLTADGHRNMKFDYCCTNPPFGVEWKKVEKQVRDEFENLGFAGRFGPGLPRVSDGSLLFLLHLVSKMRPPSEGGTRIGIVLNGSPLFTGGAGSGESEIRRYVLENDLVEAIVALPTDMFYNTGISTYVWILSNHKEAKRKGKVQLINATELWQKMKKSLGSKRKELSNDHIAQIVKLHGAFESGEQVKILDTADFGYTTVTVERPLRRFLDFSKPKIDAFLASQDFPRLCRMAGLVQRGGSDDGVDFQAFLSIAPDKWLGSTAESKEQELNSAFVQRLLEQRLVDHAFTTLEEATSFITAQFSKTSFHMGANSVEKLCDAFSQKDPRGEPIEKTVSKKSPYHFEVDPSLRDTENIPLKTDIDAYFKKEVLPHVQDAWMDRAKDKVGYEIPFNRYFYKYVPPRPLEVIDAELKAKVAKIQELLKEIIQ